MFLEENNYILSSSDENESDNESCFIDFEKHNKGVTLGLSCQNTITYKKRNGEQRLPTRRPDPNVYNRNALLARENRRKKKLYLEALEKELQMARKTNRALVKALKRQIKITKRIEQEKKYFEGLIANRSEILSLINALNFRSTTETESNNSPFSTTSNKLNNIIMNGTRGTSRCDSFNNVDSLSMQFDNISDDITDSSLPSASTNWDDIWGESGYHIDNLIMPDSTHYENKTDNIENPEQRSDTSDYIDVEVDCLQNDIYCLTNNWNSTCKTPPLQLLSDQSS
ncbi:uncharacterized protein ACRADG_011491 isoform 2-T2 [Cochliomyia hominivorax]